MYKVSCPSCRAVVSSPFVRVGAAVTCASCGHRYLIGQAHVKRVATAARSDPQQPHADAQPEAAAASTDGTPPEQGGIQGLSEMMRVEAERERDSQFDDYDTIKPDADAPRKPIDLGDEVSTQSNKKTKAQKVGRGGYLLAAAAALALAVLGGGLWLGNWDLGSGASSSPPVEELAPEPVYEGPLYQGLPLAGSMALKHNPWEQPNRPYKSMPQDDPAIFVADDGLAPSDAGVIEYVGKVVSERDDVVIDGELYVSLVNRQGMEKARTTAPLALVSQDYPMRVRLPIPPSLDPTALSPAWSITVRQSLASPVYMQSVSVQIEPMGSDTMARVFLENDTDKALEPVVLLITAWDAQGLPLQRWRVQWDMSIAPGGEIEFYTRTAVTPSWQIDSWTVLAVAEVSPIQPAVAPPGEQTD